MLPSKLRSNKPADFTPDDPEATRLLSTATAPLRPPEPAFCLIKPSAPLMQDRGYGDINPQWVSFFHSPVSR